MAAPAYPQQQPSLGGFVDQIVSIPLDMVQSVMGMFSPQSRGFGGGGNPLGGIGSLLSAPLNMFGLGGQNGGGGLMGMIPNPMGLMQGMQGPMQQAMGMPGQSMQMLQSAAQQLPPQLQQLLAGKSWK